MEEVLKKLLKKNPKESDVNLVFDREEHLITLFLPKIKKEEFLKIVMENKKSPATQVLRKLVLSRCKSKMPKKMSSLRPDLHLIYKQKKIDSVLNSGALMTFNHIYTKLFKSQQTGFFSNHVVLISGRRWNMQSKDVNIELLVAKEVNVKASSPMRILAAIQKKECGSAKVIYITLTQVLST